jgi:hypothetical protein
MKAANPLEDFDEHFLRQIGRFRPVLQRARQQ